MDEKILVAIDQEIAKFQRVRALLAGANKSAPNSVVGKKPKRSLSAKARKAIAEAQRKRWAKLKSARAGKAA